MSAEFEPITLVRHWASLRGAAPFKAVDAYEAINNIDDIQDVYRAIRELYKDKRLLARRKAKGPGYEYVWHLFAKDEFELEPAAAGVVAREPSGVDGGNAIVDALGLGKQPDPAPAEPAAPAQEETLIFPEVAADIRPESGEIPIPEFLRKQPQSFSAEAIADAMIRKLKPVLQAQFANAALESTDVLTEPCSRVTLRIEQLELTVEGLLNHDAARGAIAQASPPAGEGQGEGEGA